MNNLQFLDVNKNFAEWLKEARKEARLTMEKLGELVGKSKQYISVLERGEPHPLTNKPVTPNKDLVIALAKALNTNESEALNAAGYASTTQLQPQQQQIIETLGHSKNLTPKDFETIKNMIEFLDSQPKE